VDDFFDAVRFVLLLFVAFFAEFVDFFEAAFLAGAFFVEDDFLVLEAFFVAVDFLDEDFFAGGTFPPSRLASESPMAMACLRLVTFFPEPLFSFPRLNSCISVSTLSCAFFPYLVAMKTSYAHGGVQLLCRCTVALHRMLKRSRCWNGTSERQYVVGASTSTPRRFTRTETVRAFAFPGRRTSSS
jgi:hypothetical protein